MKILTTIDKLEPILISLNKFELATYFDSSDVIDNFDLLVHLVEIWLSEPNDDEMLIKSYTKALMELGCKNKSAALEIAEFMVTDYTITNTLKTNFRKIKRQIYISEKYLDVEITLTDDYLVAEISSI